MHLFRKEELTKTVLFLNSTMKASKKRKNIKKIINISLYSILYQKKSELHLYKI